MALAERLRGASRRVVDRLYSEEVELIATSGRPKAPAEFDGLSAPAAIRGHLILDPADSEIDGLRRGTGLQSFTRLAGETALLIVDSAALACLSFAVQRGTRVRLLDPRRAGLPEFEVTTPLRGGLGRTVLALTRVPV